MTRFLIDVIMLGLRLAPIVLAYEIGVALRHALMSYCRWSSENFKLRPLLLFYEDVGGGWTTHVAGNRVLGTIPPVPDFVTAPTWRMLSPR
jgi:hypothetical protein